MPNVGNLGNVTISSQQWPVELLHSPKSVKTYYTSPAVCGLHMLPELNQIASCIYFFHP